MTNTLPSGRTAPSPILVEDAPFSHDRPAPRKKIAHGRGLKFDNELTNKCADRLREMGLYSLASEVNVF